MVIIIGTKGQLKHRLINIAWDQEISPSNFTAISKGWRGKESEKKFIPTCRTAHLPMMRTLALSIHRLIQYFKV